MKIFISISFIISSFLLYSQEYDSQLGEIEKSKGAETVKILGETQEGILIHRHDLNGERNYIEVFDKKMNLVTSNEIETPGRKYSLENVLYTNERVYAFFSHSKMGDGARKLHAAFVSKDGTLLDLSVVAQAEDQNFNSGNFHVQLSEDKASFLITTFPPYNRGNDEEIYFSILDQELNETEKHQLKLGFDDELKQISNMLLDVKGNIHFVVHTSAFIDNGGLMSEDRKEARLYSLFQGETELKKYTADIIKDGKYFSDIMLRTDNNGNLRCAGFYCNSAGRFAEGIFSFTTNNETNAVEQVKTQKFEDKLVNAFLTQSQFESKQKRKSKGKSSKYDGIPYLKLVDFIMKPDGGFYIVSERYKDFLNTYTSTTGNDFFSNRFEFMSLIAIHVSKNNDINWHVPIPKRQVSTSDWGRYFGVYASLNSDNSLNIVYNDHEDHINAVYPKSLSPASYKRLYTVIVNIDQDGGASKSPIFSFDEMKTLSLPRFAHRTSSNDILIYGQWNKKRRLMKINVPN